MYATSLDLTLHTHINVVCYKVNLMRIQECSGLFSVVEGSRSPPLEVAMLSKLHIHQFSKMFNPENAAQQNNITSKSIWLWLFWCFWWYHQEPTEFDGCFFFFSSLFWALWRFSSSFTPGQVQRLSQTCNKQNNFTSSLLVVAHWKHTKYKTCSLLFFVLFSCSEGSLRSSLIQQYNTHADV